MLFLGVLSMWVCAATVAAMFTPAYLTPGSTSAERIAALRALPADQLYGLLDSQTAGPATAVRVKYVPNDESTKNSHVC